MSPRPVAPDLAANIDSSDISPKLAFEKFAGAVPLTIGRLVYIILLVA
jgi:hypothetical protein